MNAKGLSGVPSAKSLLALSVAVRVILRDTRY
jgi:hypothetical protein